MVHAIHSTQTTRWLSSGAASTTYRNHHE